MDKPNMTKEDLDMYLRMIEKKKIEYKNSPESLAKLEDMKLETKVRFHNQENI